MKEPEKLDHALLQKGDLFRGKYWSQGKNHVFKEIEKLDNGKTMIISFCNIWFDSLELHEPNEDNKSNTCLVCSTSRRKANGI